MKIYFNALGIVTSTDTTDEAIRQGSVGNTIKAYFSDKNNSNFVAKLNYTRPDGSKLTGLIMTPSPSDSTLYTFVLNDVWYLALAGNATFTIYLYNGDGDVVAQGQVTYPIQETDYDGEPTITQTQYDSLLTALAGKLGMPVSSLRVDELPEEGTTGLFYVIHDDENDDTRYNIYIWNSTTREYIWVGSNELDLNKYYTTEQGEDFEENVNQRLNQQDEQIAGLGQLQPSGVDTSTNILTFTENKGIWVGSDTGYWYYWNGEEYVSSGQQFVNAPFDTSLDNNSTNAVQNRIITNYIDEILKNKINVQQNPSTKNLFNKNDVIVGYFNYTDGEYSDSPTYRSSNYIPCKQNTYYGLDLSYSFVTFWNIRHEFISGVLIENSDFVFQTPNDASFIRISVNYLYLDVCMLAEGQIGGNDLQLLYEPYKSYIGASKSFSLFDYNKYQFAYIKDRKLTCNKDTNQLTALYTGIECKVVPNEIRAKVIWEDTTNRPYSGEITLISNPNGLHKVTNITDKSLHLEVSPDNLTLSLLDKDLNTTYGHRVLAIYQQFSTPLVCDGKTEHNIICSWTNTNVHIVVDNMVFDYNVTNEELKDINGTTVATGTINDYVGVYCTFEHFVSGHDRDETSMPMYKAIEIKGNNMTRIRDWFEREDGALNTTPTGENYVQISSIYHEDDNEW